MNLSHRFLRILFFIFLFFSLSKQSVFCDQQSVIKTGDLFPKIALQPPVDPKDSAYLGISGDKPFMVSDVKADLLLVEIMNINCSACQRQAPFYNKLFNLIETTPETKGRIKILAIGAGSPDKYIKEYRDYFKAPYPIVEDPDLVIYNAIGKSAVPLAIYVRPFLEDKKGVVAGTHEGMNEDYEGMFQDMKAFMIMDLSAIMKAGEEAEGQIVTAEPILTAEELASLARSAFQSVGILRGKMTSIDLKKLGRVYAALVEGKTGTVNLFAKVVSEPPPCGECHDTHFMYIFDENGKIRQFVPLQLTKYGNEEWDGKDIGHMREKIVGKSIENPFDFDEKVDAISSATITSLVIFRSLKEGKKLFKALKEGGWIK